MKIARRVTLAVLLLSLIMLLLGGCRWMPSLPVTTPPVPDVNETKDPTPNGDDYEADPEPVVKAKTNPIPIPIPKIKVTEPEIKVTEPEVKRPPKPPALAGVTVDEQVLLDHNGIIITLKSLDYDDFYGPLFIILIENESDTSITVSTFNEYTNGIMKNTFFHVSVEPGKKANEEMRVLTYDMILAGIETVAEVEFMFRIYNSETHNNIYISDLINIKTSAYDSYTQVHDDSGTLLFDEKGLKFVAKDLESDIDETYWGARIPVYIENTSDRDLIVQLVDVSVNGYMIDPYYSCTLVSGKRAYDTIRFTRSHFDRNDIENIEELEFTLQIVYSSSGYTVLGSKKCVLNFKS